MFSIRIPLQNHTATVKFSLARESAHLNSQTKGLAFKYVAQGAEQYEVGKQRLTVQAGEFLLLPQGCPFVARAEPQQQSVRGICVDFFSDVELLTEELMASQLLLGMPLPISFLSAVETVPEKASALSSTFGERWVQQLKMATAQLSARATVAQPILNSLACKTSTQQQLFLRLELAHRYIQRHYRQSLRLKELARIARVSPHRLQRCFRAVYGYSPQQMQKQIRMEAAKALLAQPDLSLQQIAIQLGYSDLAAFSNQFLRFHLLRPSQVRQRMLEAKGSSSAAG